MPESLGRYDQSMKDIYFIEGIGLCSNIYVFLEGDEISLVNTGSGISQSKIGPQLEQLGLRIGSIVKVVVTHGHVDHIGGLAEISEHVKPRVFIHERDSDALRSAEIRKLGFLKDGDAIQLGTRTLNVVHTLGHTSGSICLHDNEMILSGNTVFPGGYFGRTDLPSGSWQELVDSLERLARWMFGSCCLGTVSLCSLMLLRILNSPGRPLSCSDFDQPRLDRMQHYQQLTSSVATRRR